MALLSGPLGKESADPWQRLSNPPHPGRSSEAAVLPRFCTSSGEVTQLPVGLTPGCCSLLPSSLLTGVQAHVISHTSYMDSVLASGEPKPKCPLAPQMPAKLLPILQGHTASPLLCPQADQSLSSILCRSLQPLARRPPTHLHD